METLREKQSRFVTSVAKLIYWAETHGYKLTFGECYRTPEQAALNAQKGIGVANSLHTKRLAIDFNLFVNDEILTGSVSFKPLGEYWKSLGEDYCWGGDFKGLKDGGHFSITHGGVK